MVAGRLTEWFGRNGRDLPWRKDHDPYHVLLAEFILQQTRMETGLRYFPRILARFPTIEALAAAPEEDLMALWSGLGYYSRARNLHAAARRIVKEHGGRIPSDVQTLRELPGIGPYTAGAIASIAYDRPEPSLDGNQFRVLGRLLGVTPASARNRRRIERSARSILMQGAPRVINQALMDLGSGVCTPIAPRCEACPLSAGCPSMGRTPSRPRGRAGPRAEHWVARLHRNGERVWLRTPRRTGLLAGLWLPPMEPSPGPEAWHLEHGFSHRRWRIRLVHMRGPPSGKGRWAAERELGSLPHSALTVRLVRAAFERPPLPTVSGASRSPAAKVRLR